MSKRQRERMYPLACFREVYLKLFDNGIAYNVGAFCRGCGKPVSKSDKSSRQGVLDCITNDGDHSSLQNIQLLCKSCNGIKNPRTPVLMNRESMTFEAQKNEKGKKKFRGWAINKVAEGNGQYPYDDLVAAGAEFCDLETITIERYMKRLLSSYGPLELIDETVYFKSDRDLDKWLSLAEDQEAQILN